MFFIYTVSHIEAFLNLAKTLFLKKEFNLFLYLVYCCPQISVTQHHNF